MRKLFYVFISLVMLTSSSFSLSEADETLLTAARRGNYSEVVDAVENGANVNVKSVESGRLRSSALHFAGSQGYYRIVKFLISKGADVNIRNKFGKCPLHYAAQKGYYKIVRLLIKNGAKVNVKAKTSNRTPLHYAADGGYYRIAKLLIAKGANVNAKLTTGYTAGWTPLHFAAKRGHSKTGELLINKGARINSKGNFRGNTPLHIAAATAKYDFIRMIISKGANVNVKNKKGYTPFDFVKFYNRNQRTVRRIQALLKRHGGRSGR